MVTLTIDEATLNATRAALDERVKRLEREIKKSTLTPYDERYGITLTEDAQRALVWNIAALHETKLAQEFYAEVEPGQPEQTDPVTAAKAANDRDFHTWQAYGPEADSDALNREGDPAFNGAFSRW